jgi:hypothetical protein
VFAAATKFSDGRTTSSPGPQPTASSAMCSAAVPFATASACFAPVKSAKAASNSATRGPIDHQPDVTASCTASTSASSITRSDSGTFQRPSVKTSSLSLANRKLCKTSFES